MLRHVLLLVLVLSVSASASDPESDAPTVSALLDKSEARIGDVLTLTISAVHKSRNVSLPPRLELGPFTVVDRAGADAPRDLDLRDGHIKREFTLRIAAYETGELRIPPFELSYLKQNGEVGTVRTGPIEVKIAALLANVGNAELKDNLPPVEVLEEAVWPRYVLGGAIVLVLSTILFVLVSRRIARRVRAAAPPPPARPAHEVALEALDALRAQGGIERGEWMPFYVRLSEIIRLYLGARYGFDSLEMTTTELFEGLRSSAAPAAKLPAIEAFCAACDLVKFAKQVPTREEARATLDAAYGIVDATRPREASVALSPEVKTDAA